MCSILHLQVQFLLRMLQIAVDGGNQAEIARITKELDSILRVQEFELLAIGCVLVLAVVAGIALVVALALHAGG